MFILNIQKTIATQQSWTVLVKLMRLDEISDLSPAIRIINSNTVRYFFKISFTLKENKWRTARTAEPPPVLEKNMKEITQISDV